MDAVESQATEKISLGDQVEEETNHLEEKMKKLTTEEPQTEENDGSSFVFSISLVES